MYLHGLWIVHGGWGKERGGEGMGEGKRDGALLRIARGATLAKNPRPARTTVY